MRILIFMLSMSALPGCATGFGAHSSKMNRVSLGMTKPQVIEALGEPQSTRAQGIAEYLTYNMFEVAFGPYVPYFVRLINGKVEAYGKLGDFDSGKMPDQRIEMRQPSGG